jgi:large subunit ribosomal protein L47
VDTLRKKSIADLQQIWFQLVKERNMLSSMKEHYLRHQEELGAMPAPSRVEMVQKSMENLKRVMRERDDDATDKAIAIFKERISRGVYRFPPGPQPPPSDCTSLCKVVLETKVDEETIRRVFGRYDVYDSHKGIVSVELRLPEDVLARKQQAEEAWKEYEAKKSDYAEYTKWTQPSVYDYCDVEIAPGLWEPATENHEVVVASAIVPPQPSIDAPPPSSTLERIRHERKPFMNKLTVQLGYFPNVTMVPKAELPERPTHPDEIEGPWEAFITYDKKDGAGYAKSLDVRRINGVNVIGVEEVPKEPAAYAAGCPMYQEALREDEAAQQTLMNWPHAPVWKYEYDRWGLKKHVGEIVQYNYSNVVDYTEREALLTGKSIWKSPIEVDPSCGGSKSIPVFAKKHQPSFSYKDEKDFDRLGYI